jgi:hypothetical protein
MRLPAKRHVVRMPIELLITGIVFDASPGQLLTLSGRASSVSATFGKRITELVDEMSFSPECRRSFTVLGTLEVWNLSGLLVIARSPGCFESGKE